MGSPEQMNRAFIAGKWIKAQQTFPVTNPATGELIAEVPDCDESVARQAADSAAVAFLSWKQTTAYERARLLQQWHSLIISNSAEIERLITLEMGKPIQEARAEVAYAAGFVQWYAEEAKRIYGSMVPSQFAHKRLHVMPQPVGPVYGITPWNFPAAMVTRKVAPALAAGCTFILKPAEGTPLTALYMAELWEKAGGPAGTYQVITAADPIPVTQVMMQDERIRKLTFTGSTPVGVRLYEQAAKTIKRISLELGGHAPFIVLEDADIQEAVEQSMLAKFRNIGQSCVAANRIYVADSIHDDFVAQYTAKAAALIVGDPLDEATRIGPLIDQHALDKVKSHVEDAIQRGAKVATGGRNPRGLFFEPTVLTDIQPGMRLLEEETFGPVAPIISFESLDSVISQANGTPYGLAAYVWTRDLGMAFKLAEQLNYGIIGINDGVPSTPQAPFGGVKQSGIGREGGRWGLEEYLDNKYVSIALPS